MPDPVRFIYLLVVLLLLVYTPSAVFALNLNGSWDYLESGGSSGQTVRQFRQNYSFGVGPALSYEPSHSLSLNATVGYTQKNSIADQRQSTSRAIVPSAGLSLQNDLFSLDLSGSIPSTQSNDGDWSGSTNWATALGSEWDSPFVPELRFSYNESGQGSQDDGAVFSTETQNKNFAATVDWDLVLADISYRYQHTDSGGLYVDQSHFAKFNTGARFWDDRVTFNFSQQAQFDFLEGKGAGAAGEFSIQVGKILRYAISPDDTPVDYSDDTTRIRGESWLRAAPQDLLASPISFDAGQQIVIAIDPDPASKTSAVEIIFNAVDPAIDSSEWDIYQYRSASDDWQLIELNLLPFVDSDGGLTRVRLEIQATDQEFMLVSNDLGISTGITKVDIFQVFTNQSERKDREYNTSFGLQMQLSENVISSLGLSYKRNEKDSESDETPDVSERLTTSASLSWILSSTHISIGANESRALEQGEEQLLDRNYNLGFSVKPLSSIRVGFSVLVNERYGIELENGTYDIEQKVLESWRYNLSGNAQIYPDLTASFSLAHSVGKLWLKDSDADAGRFTDNESQSGRIGLSARLFSNFTADLTTQYAQFKDEDSTSESGSAGLGLRYRVSDPLLLRANYSRPFIGGSGTGTFSFSLNARLLETFKTHLELQASHTQAENTAQRISLNGSWRFSPNVSLVGQGGYTFSETNRYNFRLKLNFKI